MVLKNAYFLKTYVNSQPLVYRNVKGKALRYPDSLNVTENEASGVILYGMSRKGLGREREHALLVGEPE